MSECPHGHLARSCEICERDQRIAELEGRLGSIEKFDEASGLCCVKGCTELSVWCCPPLCEHHTALLEPVVETPGWVKNETMSKIHSCDTYVKTSLAVESGDCDSRHVDGMTILHRCRLHKGHDGYHAEDTFVWPGVVEKPSLNSGDKNG